MSYTFSLASLEEASMYLSDPGVSVRFAAAGDSLTSWFRRGGFVHCAGCWGDNRVPVEEYLDAPVRDHYTSLCNYCPDPLRSVVGEELSLLRKAAILLQVSSLDLSQTTVFNYQVVSEALGGVARFQPEAFSSELLGSVQSLRVRMEDRLRSDMGSHLAQHAALQLAVPAVGGLELMRPEGLDTREAKKVFRGASNAWKAQRASGGVVLAMEQFRQAGCFRPEYEPDALALFAALDEHYDALLAEEGTCLVSVPVSVLECVAGNCLGQLITSSYPQVGGCYRLEVPPVVARLLARSLPRVTDFGLVQDGDGPDVRDAAVLLHAESTGVLADPKDALLAARMLA